MQNLEVLSDPVYIEGKKIGFADSFFVQWVNDKRDLPFVYLTLKIFFTMLPVGLLLYIPSLPSWGFALLAALYFYLNNFVFKGPFGLMLHCTSHRSLYKKKYHALNHVLPWIIGPFFGQTPLTYYSHHIWMHHPENNLEEDESTTMPYQRDSLKDFFRYFFDFLFLGMYKLVSYFKRKNRPNLMRACLQGEFLFLALCLGLSFVNFWATFHVFILPFMISRLIMMLGNWTQHAFVSAEDPGNPFQNSITCINTKYNHKCWNDGYHISHHLKPGMHWTDHPHEFMRDLDRYATDEAIVFQGIGFLEVFFLLMAKRYDKLASYAVNINNYWKNEEDFIALMKKRTLPIQRNGIRTRNLVMPDAT